MPYNVTRSRTLAFTQRVQIATAELGHQVGKDVRYDVKNLPSIDPLDRGQAGEEIGAKAEFAQRSNLLVLGRNPVGIGDVDVKPELLLRVFEQKTFRSSPRCPPPSRT